MGGDRSTAYVFGCESHADYVDWVRILTSAVNMDLGRSIDLGTSIVKDLSIFKAKLRNQRQADPSGIVGFEVHFKAPLWRVKTGGDMMFYTEDDVSSATVELILDGVPARPHAFRVSVPPLDDFVFAPDNFAAQSSECLKCWLDEFEKFRNSFN